MPAVVLATLANMGIYKLIERRWDFETAVYFALAATYVQAALLRREAHGR